MSVYRLYNSALLPAPSLLRRRLLRKIAPFRSQRVIIGASLRRPL